MNIQYNNIKISIMKKLAIILLSLLALKPATAQIGVNIDTPDSSAVLHIDAPDRGLLIPRHTEEGLVQQPADGLLYYNKQNGLFNYYDEQTAKWKVLVPADVEPNEKEELIIEAKVTITDTLTVQKDVIANNYSSNPNNRGNGPIPAGGVIMWSGNVGDIPTGWALCDGTNGTPDLRGRFIVGYHATEPNSNSSDPAYADGQNNAVIPGSDQYNALGKHKDDQSIQLQAGETPVRSHTHWVLGSTQIDGRHSHAAARDAPAGARIFFERVVGAFDSQPLTGAHSHSIDFNSQGPNENPAVSAHENRPPYYVLAYIMKLPK
jgi:microcystin-dependent protein